MNSLIWDAGVRLFLSDLFEGEFTGTFEAVVFGSGGGLEDRSAFLILEGAEDGYRGDTEFDVLVVFGNLAQGRDVLEGLESADGVDGGLAEVRGFCFREEDFFCEGQGLRVIQDGEGP